MDIPIIESVQPRKRPETPVLLAQNPDRTH
jgi:hypothetical protein